MKRRPSPSMLIALSALVIALGGSAYAAGGLINGAKLKNGSVTGSKIKKDSLTGKQIKESTLGTVPAAKRATSATSATTAGHATSADSASSLSAIAASRFVQGGGQAFSASKSLAFTSQDNLSLPELGALNLNCFNNGQMVPTLNNQTGATVQVSIQTVTGAGTAAAGHTVLPGATLFSAVSASDEQEHVSLVWSGHSADLTVGWYDAASQCVVVVTGFVR